MNPNDISEQSKSDKHVNLLNFNNVVRGVKELLGTSYCREHFEVLNTGTSRTLRIKFPASASDEEADYPFKCSETGTLDLLRFRRPVWDRNTIVGTVYTDGIIPDGDGDASLDVTSFANTGGTFWVRASMQIDPSDSLATSYSELYPVNTTGGAPFTASLEATTAAPSSEAAYGRDIYKYIVEVHATGSHVTDWMQLQRGAIQDHLVSPDTDWRGTSAERSETIEYRVNSVNPQYKALSLRGSHTDVMVPIDSVKIPIVVRTNGENGPAHVRYFMFDTQCEYPSLTPNPFKSLELEPARMFPPNDAGFGIAQIRNFYNGTPNVCASTDLVCVRTDMGGGTYDISWPTVSDIVVTAFGGTPGSAASIPVNHHFLLGLTTYDDHGGQDAFYLQLGTLGTYNRNTATTGTVMIGEDASVETDLFVGNNFEAIGNITGQGHCDITGSLMASTGTMDLNMICGGTVQAGAMMVAEAGSINTDLVVVRDYYQGAAQGATNTTGFYLFDSTGTVSVGGPYYLRGGIICAS